eukprot:45443-Lingulodinium_polyedra.AAC.1
MFRRSMLGPQVPRTQDLRCSSPFRPGSRTCTARSLNGSECRLPLGARSALQFRPARRAPFGCRRSI